VTLNVNEGHLLVAEKTRHGRIAGAMGHTLVAVDEDGLGLDDNVLLNDKPLILEIFQRVFRLVQLLLKRVTDAHQLVTFAHHTEQDTSATCQFTVAVQRDHLFTASYLLNICEFVNLVCGPCPPKRRVVRWRNFALRRVQTMCKISSGFYV